MDSLVQLTGTIDSAMYTYVLTFLLIFAGVYFSIRTRFVQVRYLKDMFKAVSEPKHSEGKKTISSFQALMISTASRVGTGNIAGVSTAIATGGPGAVFWMWLMSIVGASSAFVESTLAQIFKVKGKNGSFIGGPAYYIQQGLGKRWLGIVFALLLIFCYAYGFNGLQAYNMSSALELYIPNYTSTLAPVGLGLVLSAVIAFVFFGGTHRISVMTSVIVPIMAIGYILVAIAITFMNLGSMGIVWDLIITSAFDGQAIFGGFAGSVVTIGIKRGLFSNEAGMGSAPNAAATASVSHPVKQGLVQTLSVYIDTLIICSCTAFMVLIFMVNGDATGLNGMPLVQNAVGNTFGQAGINFVTFAIFAFAFSSLIGNYFYAEGNIKFISDSKIVLTIFRVTCVVAVYVGCITSFDLAWNMADITMGLMAFVNIIAIVLLGEFAFGALADYSKQRAEGKNPVFLASSLPGLPEVECWHEATLPDGSEHVISEAFSDNFNYDDDDDDN